MKRTPAGPGIAERIEEVAFWLAHAAAVLVVLGIAGVLLAAVVVVFGS